MRQHMKDYVEWGTSGAARGVRIMAEYLSAVEAFDGLTEKSLVTVFGSARLDQENPSARLAERLARVCVDRGYGVITGGSSGIMLSANRGAYQAARERGLDVREYSVGCAVTLPFEEGTNRYLGTQTDFHYFFIRKFFLVAYSRAFFFLEGGGGTRDELWEVFCLIQTGKMPIHPLVAVGDGEVWRSLRADLDHMAERGTISDADRNIVHFVDTTEEAVDIVERFYSRVERIEYDKSTRTINFHLKDELEQGDRERIKARFGDTLNGLEWYPEERCLSASQFNFRSYTVLYEVVEALNEARDARQRSGEALRAVNT